MSIEVDRCFMHNESGPPSSHVAPIGNDNAEGNSGGDAPELNLNTAKYGAWYDWRKLYEHLEGDAKASVEELTESSIESSNKSDSEELKWLSCQ